MRVATTFGKPFPERRRESTAGATACHLLVLADCGGATEWGKPIAVDRDNIDEVMQRLQVTLRIDDDATLPQLTIPFASLDDFHPDHLFGQLEVFESLRKRRQRLENDTTFAEESKSILSAQAPVATPPPDSHPSPSTTATALPAQDLLSATLEQTEAAQKPLARQLADGSFNVDALVQRLVAPYVTDKPDPRKPEFIAAVDQAISDTMRRLLHHHDFQRLEATWLGLKMLVRRLETDATLQLSLLNVSKRQLRDDLCQAEDLTRSQLSKLLVDSAAVAGSEPWSAVVADFSFDASPDDCELLGRVARVHAAADAVFIAGASPAIVGCPGFAQTADPHDWTGIPVAFQESWESLRSLPESAHVVLALPRTLGRRPYGADSDPIESFRFEEIPDGEVHEQYLWINSAFAVATLLGQCFTRGGWSLNDGWEPELDRLPIHVYELHGESIVKPCGEVELLLRAGSDLAAHGLTAVHSVRDQDSIRIPSLVPLGRAAKSIGGPWQ